MPGTLTPSGPWTSRQCLTASSRGIPSWNRTSQMTLYMRPSSGSRGRLTLLDDHVAQRGAPHAALVEDVRAVDRGGRPARGRERLEELRLVVEPALREAREVHRVVVLPLAPDRRDDV